MNKLAIKQKRRAVRTRSKINGTKERPRLVVFRSNRFIYLQLIDDYTKKTMFGLSEKQLPKTIKGTKTERAKELGLLLASIAKTKKIKQAVFDRGQYAYHGRIKAVADGAREGGLKI